ncbi:MAG: PH domain-containing protein [Clostridia bacterium]|nr:PH domain-containing protein [Clostridia bacterium]MBP3554475.1 PH domain-containing protein [Clostridia bacterium]MBQ8419838.1 PH domain-containing protein [Clostridia bacterium]
MIDFQNGSYVKLRKVGNGEIGKNLEALLLADESIIGVYKGIRDYVVFTDKRVIAANVQGLTGKKQDFTSLPYKKISVFSIETSGVFDLDSELELYFSGVGKVSFEFTGASDIVQIGKIISQYAL